MAKQQPADIERKVNEYLGRDEFLKRLGTMVLPGTANVEQGIWYVAVGTTSEADQKFEYYEHLSAAEDRLKSDEELNIMIAPSGVKHQK